MSETHVILLGASTRAAAMSARRAGWTPWCVDLFADADLQRIASVRKISTEGYPNGLLDALADAPQAPVIYTGALENRPDLVARIDRPLWGNPPEVLRAVRSPERWTQALRACGLPCPALSTQPSTGRWLLKQRKSAGGFGIQDYVGQPFNPRSHFLQEWIDGVPCSAIFLGHVGGALLLGVTEQLVGTPWLNTNGFHYAGTIGPMLRNWDDRDHWQQIGSALAQTFPLRGLFGVDAILRDGVPWPVEINPRYTASVEVLERAYQVPLLPWHRVAFSPECQSVGSLPLTPGSAMPEVHGKAILFARKTLTFPERGLWQAALQAGVDLDQVKYADIPQVGEVIEQGRPVLTLFVKAATASDCLRKLQEKAQTLDRHLWG